MTDGKGAYAGDRSLGRLVRFVLASGPCAVRAASEGLVDLQGAKGAVRRVPRASLDCAVSRGLVRVSGDRLDALAEARAFLRRLLADDVEEATAAQHRHVAQVMIATVDNAPPQRVRRNLDETPLGPLARLTGRDGNPYFPTAALAAADRLAADFDRAGLQPQITQSWEPRLSQAGGRRHPQAATISDSAAAARARLGDALDAIGPELGGVALDVCCFGKGLELVERERQWPARAAKLMLRTALMTLSRYYQPPARSRHRHWGTEDFRPEL